MTITESNEKAARKIWPAARRLCAQRAQLVQDYLPLVGAHIKRRVKCQRDGIRRNRDDLFQEGCLGLIRAALRFDPAAGISFAAFARPRIRGAVNRALGTRDNLRSVTVMQMLRVADARCIGGAGAEEEANVLCDEKLEARIEETLRRAKRMLDDRDEWRRVDEADSADDPGMNMTADDGNRALERRLREKIVDRMLQVEGADRRSLRDIARESGAPYARVRRCVRDVQSATRQLLAADPEVPARLRERVQRIEESARAKQTRHDPTARKCVLSTQERLELLLQSRRQRQQRYRMRQRRRIGMTRKLAKKRGKMRHQPF